MKKMSANELREMWVSFWKSKNHDIVESASLLPINDPSILFINAGVTPLKKYFDGSEIPKNRRIASIQRCLRTNDIDNVGVTARHQTFFEMLGNFSIGDYFRDEAISWAYEFLTSDKYLDIPVSKLYVTVYTDDKETFNKWLSLGMPHDHIILLDTNFWEIGQGPSGPDSEVFFDRGEKYDPDHLGIKLLEEEIENDRYIEIWNNVFSQYNATPGLDRNDYPELPSKNIDTGMGLERMLTIFQDAPTNFDTDLFIPIINKIEEISGKTYHNEADFKIIADHVRALTFALADGANFGNTGRDYVLRRLLRRSIRYGKKIGINDAFMGKLVPIVVDIMKFHYPYLITKMDMIINKINTEENLFHKTLENGEKKLQEIFENSHNKTISGEDAFKLYDTYGFPFELTLEYALEKGFQISKDDFEKSMKKQKELARSSRDKINTMSLQNEELINFKDESNFIGYDSLNCETKIIKLFDGKHFVESLTDEGYIVLSETPFYATSGGQVADSGVIIDKDINIDVIDVFKGVNKQHFHYCKWNGTIYTFDDVSANVDEKKRSNIAKNHSAAHLLQKALKEVLGEEVKQAGSRIDENNLRFDIYYEGKISKDDLIMTEKLVNYKINHFDQTSVEVLPIEEAKKTGAISLFDEKYGDTVRVVTIADSKEFCGGTHVKTVKDIKRFAIKQIESKGNNIYRIEAATDLNIERELFEAIKPYNDDMIKLLEKAKNLIKQAMMEGLELDFDFNINNDAPHNYSDVLYNLDEVTKIKENVSLLEKKYNEERVSKALSNLEEFKKSIKRINNVDVLIKVTENYDLSILKSIIDKISNEIKGLVFIINKGSDKLNLIAKANLNSIDCSSLIKSVFPFCEGKGGGSKTYAQGGGSLLNDVSPIIDKIESEINRING